MRGSVDLIYSYIFKTTMYQKYILRVLFWQDLGFSC